jgi:hypothetical protein
MQGSDRYLFRRAESSLSQASQEGREENLGEGASRTCLQGGKQLQGPALALTANEQLPGYQCPWERCPLLAHLGKPVAVVGRRYRAKQT